MHAIESSEKRGSSLMARHFSQGINHVPFVHVRHQTNARERFFQVTQKHWPLEGNIISLFVQLTAELEKCIGCGNFQYVV